MVIKGIVYLTFNQHIVVSSPKMLAGPNLGYWLKYNIFFHWWDCYAYSKSVFQDLLQVKYLPVQLVPLRYFLYTPASDHVACLQMRPQPFVCSKSQLQQRPFPESMQWGLYKPISQPSTFLSRLKDAWTLLLFGTRHSAPLRGSSF